MARPSVEAERRRQILTAACEAIAELGFRGVRVADVARRADVSSGTVHYYFDGKDALLRAAFAFNFDSSLRRRQWMHDPPADPLRRLDALLASYLPHGPATTTAWRVWIELWAAALGSPELQRLNDAVYDSWRAIVRDAVDAVCDAGLTRPGLDRSDITEMLIGMLDGLAIQALIRSSRITRARMLEICDAAVHSLLADGVPTL
ncbi:TetR/AcrR family transcriptional regulator [Tomitella gaofuii]|uniref:TetR/AcrR family transcriptional regulator n=1 Tax=Tomitella gaofuii TaxID=2760083 RepID=UPI0015FE0B11|nr:TetR/AcrR family transcriptional regulator [Tomitella gaofuii]